MLPLSSYPYKRKHRIEPLKITMMTPKATDVKKGIALLWETLQCPICLDLMTTPVSTKCDHQFCKFCITKLLDNSKQNGANCPVCKSKITKRSLQESLGFQRLVAGLQDMIQAYEHDTCTNYFTGQPRGNKNFTNALKSKNVCDLSSGHTIGTQPDNKGNLNRDDSPQSCSSTVAAQNGFAQLMGLEDSAENEGLDSGLGDIPPTSDKKMSGSTDDFELETADVAKNSKPTCSAKNKKSSVKPEKSKPNQEESDQRHIRKSSRKKQKQDLEPDKILEQKKKKSLEKVARWLLKVPAEDELEVDDDLPNAADSYSCSSTSTLDVNMRDVALNPTREDRAKALEEQVFGAIYKRSGGKRTTAEETKTCKRLSKWRKKSNVGVCEERQMVSEQTAVDEKLDKTVDRLSESCTNQAEHEVPVADDVQPDMTATKRSVKAREIDCDLHEPTLSRSKGTREKSNGRKGKKSKSTIRKPTKLAIPLVLVGVQSRETSPKPSERAKEVEVQIETYPSSEEQTTPVMRSSRRSRRLQLFVEEVQGCNKKTPSRSCATEADKGGDKLTDVANDKSVDATLPQSGILTKGDQRNGCVFEEDIGGIESMEKSRETYLRQAEAEVPEAQALALPDADLTVSVVPNTTSQSDPSAIGPTLESERQENNCPSDFQPETCVDEAKRAAEECEDGKNDGELDTEQLLRSFKAAKRKSFLLGAPNTKRSRGSDEDDASSQLTENINQVANGSDVISPSHSPSQIRKPFQARLEASSPNSDSSGQELDAENCLTRSSFSSGLSPNKVSKRDRESPLSVVPQVVDSDLRFTAVDHGASRGPQITDGQSDSNLKEITDGISKCPSVSQAKAMFIEESSLTPDDLGIHEVNGGVGNQSSIKSNPGRRRRAQRLESLSGSDSSGSKEDLPTLAQIFGTLDRPQAEIKPQGKLGETTRLEDVAAEVLGGPPGSPSPDRLDSSQASVDLFGTPDECDAPEKDASVLFESSQFSSEVLVTQQKVEMQQELVRLEKLMALVSEVLQEKEGSPPREVASDTDQDCNKGGPDTHTSLLNDQDQVPSSDRRERPPDDKVTTEPEVGKHGSVSDAAVHHSTHAGLHIKDIKSPNSMPATKTVKHCDSLPDGQEDKENNSPPKEKSKAKLVLVSSGLGPSEQTMVKKFAKRVGGRVVSQVTPEVTHIIMRTDDQLVCERTLKYFLGIAGRKWVVSFQWISECFKDKKLLEESSFEVRGDVVNGPNHQGPSRARTTADCNLLMKGYKICFKGPFTDMSTDEMEWMVELCGATVVKEPILLDEKQKSQQIVIVQPRSECSSSSYSSLSRKATVVTRGWLLDTVATYKLQNYSNYTV